MPATTNTTEGRIASQVEALGWQIEDAKKDLARTAAKITRRAAEATEMTNALIANQPCHQGWVSFLESDAREARENEARLKGLIERLQILTWLTKGVDAK